MSGELRVVRDGRSILVESIFWDERTDELVWVDITAGSMHRGRLDGPVDGSDDRVVRLPAPLSAVQPAVDGGFVVSGKDRILLLDADGEVTREIAHVTHAHTGIRFNEGKVDPLGRFVVGGMNLTTGEADAGLYAFALDGTVEVLRGGFAVANGFEWSDDGREMFLTDTGIRTVYRAPYADGALGEFAPFLVGRMSDGLAHAADGTFFNGVYGDGEVVHWAADGAVVGTHRVPMPNVTSVAFGGPGFATLFVGSARENLSEEQLSQHPLSGGIVALDTGAVGRAPFVFGVDAR